MKCDMKTMMKAALGLGVAIAVAYATMPAARAWILASASFLFFLLCPLMMFFMMKGMQSYDEEQRAGKMQADKAASPPVVGHSPPGD